MFSSNLREGYSMRYHNYLKRRQQEKNRRAGYRRRAARRKREARNAFNKKSTDVVQRYYSQSYHSNANASSTAIAAAKNNWEEKNAEMQTIEEDERDALKKWYKLRDGDNKAWNEEIRARGKAKVKDELKTWDERVDQFVYSIKGVLSNLKTIETYCPKAENLDSLYMNVLDKSNYSVHHIDNAIEKTMKKASIAHRLASYYDNNDYYNDLLYYVKWIYWLMALFCVLSLFVTGQWRNIKTYVFLLIILIFPLAILGPVITFANTNISKVKISTLYMTFVIMAALIVSMLYFSGNYAMPTEKIPQPQ